MDYLNQIIKDIEKEVAFLKYNLENFEGSDGKYPTRQVNPDYVEIGYLVNSYKGNAIFNENDKICGLPIIINNNKPNYISVVAKNVQMVEESWDEDTNTPNEYIYYTDLVEYTNS